MEELQRAIQSKIDQHGGLRAAARAMGIEPGYLSRLHRGSKCNPSEKILRKLGLERVNVYRQKKLRRERNGARVAVMS